ncbi:MAG: diguanylate cyclase [Thermoanaerobaculia bacterium]
MVDDEESVLLTAGRTLLRESMEVHEASSVQKALLELQQWEPDALVVDLLFEDGSGLDVIRGFRAAREGRDGVVIVISVLDEFTDKLESMRAGADAYFTKPVDWDALARRLTTLLQVLARDVSRRVLLVEDDLVDAVRTRTILGASGYQVLVCTDPASFGEDLDGFQPDVILMDVNLPGASGYELARYARQQERYAATPILFLTADRSEGSRLQAIQSGGDDHLSKPASEELLLSSIDSRLRRSQSVISLLERDGLTGLLSHSVVMSRAAVVIQEKTRHPARKFALVMIDLDHFKQINDRYGHVVGDKVLAALAAFLRAQLRSTDILGRYGGEEFVVVLPDIDSASAAKLVERLLANFRTLSHTGDDGTSFHVAFSAGVAELEAGWSLEEWKVLADQALYEAKESGRGRVCVAGPSRRPIAHTTGILDPDVVASLRELGRRSSVDLLSEVTEMFLRVAPDRMESLRTACVTANARALEMTAHAFRSSAANIGASELSRLCEAIESAARNGNLESMESLVEATAVELSRVTRALAPSDNSNRP